jgi:coenzyme F420-0:L-glutamate ligase / coenzyme F420-1:gamma-L-glutamate ligase
MTRLAHLEIVALRGLPLVEPDHDLAIEIAAAARAQGEPIGSGDVVVIAQKVVSKAEGRTRDLTEVAVSSPALELASRTGRPPALAQLILEESSEVLRASEAAIIARHTSGHVLANAGIDASNVAGGSDTTVLLWPRDPDASARRVRDSLAGLLAARPAVIVADSMGRAWRIGTAGTAIGCAGIAAIEDRRGQFDLYGRTLQATVVAIADSLAAAAVLVMGEGDEGTPVGIVRGAQAWVTEAHGAGAAAGLRPIEQDMFR